MPIRSDLQARIALPQRDSLSVAGQRVYDSILSSRGNLDGPFLAWLHRPELADRAEKLGAFCRFDTGLPTLESELLILITAAHFRCSGEWQIHAPIALQAGLDGAAIEQIRLGHEPCLTPSRLQTLYRFSSELLRFGRVADETFAQAQTLLGDAGLVELVGVLGYYTMVAMTLNAFEMKFRERTDPFAPAT